MMFPSIGPCRQELGEIRYSASYHRISRFVYGNFDSFIMVSFGTPRLVNASIRMEVFCLNQN